MKGTAFLACCLLGGSVICCFASGAVAATAKNVARVGAIAADVPFPRPSPTAMAKATPVQARDAAIACPGHPSAIGTSRTIVVDPASLPQIGTMQYTASLPLNDHEVVLTFDDGPVHSYTARVLDILARNCVKATYFLVGEQAAAYPRLVRRIYNEGHSIGTHSENHPLKFNSMSEAAIAHQVDAGIAAVTNAVGDPRAVSPFFRIPGLRRSKEVDGLLASRSLSVWSADEVADDWHHGITPHQIVRLAMTRIAAKGHRGVLLLHDIHPATADALPLLLTELKEHGYRIVHAIPSGERPLSVPPRPTTVIASHQGEHNEPTVSHKLRMKHHAHHRRSAHVTRHRAHKRRHARARHHGHAQLLSALAHRRHNDR